MIDNLVLLKRCILLMFPSTSVWNYSKTSPLLCMALILKFACSGGWVQRLKATLRTHDSHMAPGSGSCLEIRIKCSLFLGGGAVLGWSSDKQFKDLYISNESEPKTSELEIYTGQQRCHASRPSSPLQIISSLCSVVLSQQRYFWCYSLHII